MFSKSWKSSKNPRKQKKYRFNAPLHIKRKFLSSSLSKSLRQKYSKRSVPVIKGDKVKIISGSFKGKEGTVMKVSTKRTFINIDVVYELKKSGSKAYYPVHPSNVQIIELNLKDSKRESSLRKDKINKKSEKKSETKSKAETKKTTDVEKKSETKKTSDSKEE